MASDLGRLGQPAGINVPADLFISYRKAGDTSAKFVNITQLLTSNDYTKIYSVYENILANLSTYPPELSTRMKAIQTQLHNRLNQIIKQQSKLHLKSPSTVFSLGIVPFIRSEISVFREQKLDKTHQSFVHQLDLLEQRGAPKTTISLLPELEAVFKLRRSKPKKELERLIANERIASSFNKVESAELYPEELVAFGRMLEIRETLKKTHYVFSHGQCFGALFLNLITKKLKSLFDDTQYRSFTPLRHDVFLENIDESERTISWYKGQLTRVCYITTEYSGPFMQELPKEEAKKYPAKDMIPAYRWNDGNFSELISGDCYLESLRAGESALDFFMENSNEAFRMNRKFSNVILSKMLPDYFPNIDIRKRLVKELLSIPLLKGGTLYAICVPKDKLKDVGYLSKPYGRPVTEKYTRKQITRMQQGFRPKDDPETFPVPEGESPPRTPQVRLLAHKLKPEDGIFIIPNSVNTEAELEELEIQIETALERAFNHFKV